MTLIDPSEKVEARVESIPLVANKRMALPKKKNDAAVITLVHGDVLVLIGDDFEVIYSE
jgi:alkylated DNA repair dioxygenase AlkB